MYIRCKYYLLSSYHDPLKIDISEAGINNDNNNNSTISSLTNIQSKSAKRENKPLGTGLKDVFKSITNLCNTKSPQKDTPLSTNIQNDNYQLMIKN